VSSRQTRVGKPSERVSKQKEGSIQEESVRLVIFKGPHCKLHMVIWEYRVHM